MNNLKVYLPKIYSSIEETNAILESEQINMEEAEVEIEKVKNSQYVTTADITGIQYFENLLGIKADPSTEDIEFRRARIINRLSTKPPFTFNYLRTKLDELIGVDKWTAEVDFPNYVLYIDSAAENQFWAQEIYITLNKIKPANLIYVNRPYTRDTIKINERVSYSQITHNYKLGSTWVLGAKPFADIEEKGEIKLAGAPSIQQELLNSLAASTATKIAKVLINDILNITSFTIKSATNNLVSLEYTVPSGSGVTTIENIKLLDATNKVLSDSTVYVPLFDDAILKHRITIIEGV